MDQNIPEKANKVLNLILLGLLLILVRVWYLSIIQHDEHLEKARRPKRRVILEKVERATIRDRFNTPLALNKIQYNAAVCYCDIRHIPSAKWVTNEKGKRVKIAMRSAYIKQLSRLLAEELKLDSQTIEDTIHAKASLFPQTPFIIKTNLSEEEYYRLKGIEKDWVGIAALKGSKRYYPLGKVGCDVIGYMGAISSKEYSSIAEELQLLEAYLEARESGEMPILPKGFQNPLEVRERVRQLQEKAYTIHDLVGKMGIEGAFDADLRGFSGKKTVEVDTKGNLIRELPGGRKAIAGQRILLSISAELQEYAEALLAENEKSREKRTSDGEVDFSVPWIKGGAIVAIEPKTGEVLALASYPRIDPNDFITSEKTTVAKWLENESYIGQIWDGKKPLERERFDASTSKFYTESCPLTWQRYLDTILSKQSSSWNAMRSINTLGAALEVQENPLHPLLMTIPTELDRSLVKDLCTLIADKSLFSKPLINHLHSLPLEDYRYLTQAASIIRGLLKEEAKLWFKNLDFQVWRQDHFKEFLKLKRKQERADKKYARPYTDYLEQVEHELFETFWQENELAFLYTYVMGSSSHEKLQKYLPYLAQMAPCEQAEKMHEILTLLPPAEQMPFLKTLRSFEELTLPLSTTYRSLRGNQLRHLASSFYPLAGYGYGRSQAFRQSTPQGSVFKLVIAYQAMIERYKQLKADLDLNPLTLVDNLQWHSKRNSSDQVLGYTVQGAPIKRLYKGGWLPRSSHSGIGTIDLEAALERSSNFYFSLLAIDHLSDPCSLIETSKKFGFGEKTGIELPGEIPGVLPGDLSYNRSGLYAFAIGQHSLVVTPLQTAMMINAIANKGVLVKPKIVSVIAGHESVRDYQDPFSQILYPFKDYLSSIGIGFPLFTIANSNEATPYVWTRATEKKEILDMPDPVHQVLIQGMYRVINNPHGTAYPFKIRSLVNNPQEMKLFQTVRNRLIAKTGTAEILYKQFIDAEATPAMQTHVWFGGMAFEEETPQTLEHPELVVVVYLRFSHVGGKETAPLAAKMVKKWEEICKKHGGNAYFFN